MNKQQRKANESILAVDRYIDRLYLEGREADLKGLLTDTRIHVRVKARQALRDYDSAMTRKGYRR